MPDGALHEAERGRFDPGAVVLDRAGEPWRSIEPATGE